MSSDTTLQTTEAGVDTDIRQRDIVVGVDGSDESFAALGTAGGIPHRPAGQCGIWLDTFVGYGFGTGFRRAVGGHASWHRETSAGLGGAGQFRHGHQ
mgnify:CR=1 FL=1